MLIMLIYSYLPLIIAMFLPFVVLHKIQQAWISRPAFVLLGIIIAVVVFLLGMAILSAVLLPLTTKFRWTNQQLEMFIYIKLAFTYIFNIGVTYWLLLRIAPFFKQNL